MLGVAMPLSNHFSSLMDIPVRSIMQNHLDALHLAAALPPASTRELYESAVKCHLAMRAVWAACPRSNSDATIWLDFYYDIWVHLDVLVHAIVLMIRAVPARADGFLGGRVCTRPCSPRFSPRSPPRSTHDSDQRRPVQLVHR
jgi:hypothetical protein